MRATLLSAASTHFISTGTYYGLTVAPAAGGTVVVADLVDAGHKPNIATSSTWGGVINDFHFVAAGNPAHIDAHGTKVVNGLTVAYTSTRSVTLFHD